MSNDNKATPEKVCQDLDKYIQFVMKNIDFIFGINREKELKRNRTFFGIPMVFGTEEVESIKDILTKTIYFPLDENRIAVFVTSDRRFESRKIQYMECQTRWLLATCKHHFRTSLLLMKDHMYIDWKTPFPGDIVTVRYGSVLSLIHDIFSKVKHAKLVSQHEPMSLTKLAAKKLTKEHVMYIIHNCPNMFKQIRHTGITYFEFSFVPYQYRKNEKVCQSGHDEQGRYIVTNCPSPYRIYRDSKLLSQCTTRKEEG